MQGQYQIVSAQFYHKGGGGGLPVHLQIQEIFIFKIIQMVISDSRSWRCHTSTNTFIRNTFCPCKLKYQFYHIRPYQQTIQVGFSIRILF